MPLRLAALDLQDFPGVQATLRNGRFAAKSSPNLEPLQVPSTRLLTNYGVHIMNKSDLVDSIAADSGLSKADAGRALDAFVSNVTSTLQSGQSVSLVGFGTFSVKHRDARQGRNPRTGETIQIKASNNPAFKAGKAFKDAVN
jgi:DNA-binding protein HU-beta